jgi:hypothetical protein
MSGDHWGGHNWEEGATSIKWVKVSEAMKHSTMYRMSLHPYKELHDPNVNSAKAEQPTIRDDFGN